MSHSSLLHLDCMYVWEWIYTDGTQASRLQAKGRQCYFSQNIGPAVAGSAGPAAPSLVQVQGDVPPTIRG